MPELHFLRPWILLAMPFFLVVYWLVRRRLYGQKRGPDYIAPHLLAALVPAQKLRDKIKPWDWVMGFAVVLTLAAAGPAWYKQSPDDGGQPPVVLVVKLTQSMLANDFTPSRLARGKLKIQDLLKLRGNAKTALVAYAASSHRVVPMTEDERVFLPFIEALSPQIMPDNTGISADDVAAAIHLASEELERAGGGAIVLIADGLAPDQVSVLTQADIPFIWWQFATAEGGVIANEQGELLSDLQGQARRFRLNDTQVQQLSQVQTQRVTVSEQDLLELEDKIQHQFRTWQNRNPDLPYVDMAWYFTWPVLLFAAYWFRRGFTTPQPSAQSTSSVYGVLLIAGLAGGGLGFSSGAVAKPVDWFLSVDQQGHMAFDNKDYVRAAELFTDPMWKGTALFRAGKYEQAAEAFAQAGTLQGLYNRANALLKNFQYQAAITAYEQVLREQADYPAAEHNLRIARAALKIAQETPPDDDMEQNNYEVDDQVSESEDSEESQQYQVAEQLSPDAREQWMRSVDSDMSDFLKTKFANEAAKRKTPP